MLPFVLENTGSVPGGAARKKLPQSGLGSRTAMKFRRIWGSCLWLVGCAASPGAPAVEQPRKVASAAPVSVASVAPVASALPSAAPSAAPPSAAPPMKLSLTQVLAVPISAIAVGEGTRIAVLADTPYVGDKR